MARYYYQWYGKKWMFCDTRKRLAPLERLCCRELCDLASFNDPLGSLSKPIGGGYTPLELAKTIGVSPKIVRGTLSKLSPDFLVVDKLGIITINNWWSYQPDPSKKAKYDSNRYQQNKEISQGTHNELTPLDGEGDIDKEGEGEKSTPPSDFDGKFLSQFAKAFPRERVSEFALSGAKAIVKKLGSEDKLFAMMKEYGTETKKWGWLVKDVNDPKAKDKKKQQKKPWSKEGTREVTCGHCDERVDIPLSPGQFSSNCPDCGGKVGSSGEKK